MLETFDFLQNKYTKWYFNIISNAQNRDISSYTEKHHIIPKSLGGSNKQTNLVKLTAREHFICHWLLTKMVDGDAKSKMCKALYITQTHGIGQYRYKITSRMYNQIKLMRSLTTKNTRTGSQNYNFGKKWSAEKKANSKGHKKTPYPRKPHTEESKKKMQQSAIERWTSEERFKFGEIRKKNMFTFVCPYCNKSGKGRSNYIRWHGNNCKARIIQGELKFQD